MAGKTPDTRPDYRGFFRSLGEPHSRRTLLKAAGIAGGALVANHFATELSSATETPSPLPGGKQVYGETTPVSNWNGLVTQLEGETASRRVANPGFKVPSSGEYWGVAVYSSNDYFRLGRNAVAVDMKDGEDHINGILNSAGMIQRYRNNDAIVFDGTVPQSDEPDKYVGSTGNTGPDNFMGIFNPSGRRLGSPGPYNQTSVIRYSEIARGILRLQNPSDANVSTGQMDTTLVSRLPTNFPGVSVTSNPNWYANCFTRNPNLTGIGQFPKAQLEYRRQYADGDMFSPSTTMQSNEYDDFGPDNLTIDFADLNGSAFTSPIAGINYYYPTPTGTDPSSHFIYDTPKVQHGNVNIPWRSLFATDEVRGGTVLAEVTLQDNTKHYGIGALIDRNMMGYQFRTASQQTAHGRMTMRTMTGNDPYDPARLFNRGTDTSQLDEPAPASTATPLPDTATPINTATRTATLTPNITTTPTNTLTRTPSPDATPTNNPSNTPTSSPDATASPTHTRTRTPSPSASPDATLLPGTPSATPDATATLTPSITTTPTNTLTRTPTGIIFTTTPSSSPEPTSTMLPTSTPDASGTPLPTLIPAGTRFSAFLPRVADNSLLDRERVHIPISNKNKQGGW